MTPNEADRRIQRAIKRTNMLREALQSVREAPAGETTTRMILVLSLVNEISNEVRPLVTA